MRKRNRFWRRLIVIGVASLILAVFGTSVHAQEVTPDMVTGLQVSIDTVWVLLTAMLVFFMQAGFAMLEAGMIGHRATVNALLENFMDAGLTGIMFWAVGYGIAFGTSAGGLLGTDGFFLSGAITFGAEGASYAASAYPNLNVLTFFFFQFAFAATASTIATGAMAERTDFIGDLIYSALIALFIYPVVVHWVWGGGWLFQNGFHDFAGSTVVHTVGGVIALVGAIMLGPRTGRVFGKPPRPHNLALATIGTMILWFGWYGFNPGSTLGVGGYEGLMGLTTVNTTLAASAALLVSMIFMFFRTGKWDLSAALNGSLAGLVGITAGCAFVAPWAAVVIGVIAGVVVILAVDVLEALKIDDAVGAFPVHGVCGILGTLAIGLFGQPELTLNGNAGLLVGGGVDLLIAQAVGSLSTVAFVGICSVIMFVALRAVGRLRVNRKADVVGIDVYEHGATVWPDVLPFPEEGIKSESGARAASPAAGD